MRLPSETKENWRLNYTHEVRAEWKRGEQNPLTIQGKQCGTSHTQDEGLLKEKQETTWDRDPNLRHTNLTQGNGKEMQRQDWMGIQDSLDTTGRPYNHRDRQTHVKFISTFLSYTIYCDY